MRQTRFKSTDGQFSGRSESTAFYDRRWGIRLKLKGWHDQNKWGDDVVLVGFGS
jgi:hypothetical protein